MGKIKTIIQPIAPTLGSALGGSFAGVATKYITDGLVSNNSHNTDVTEETIENLLNNSSNLHIIKNIEQDFKLEMKKLGVDIFSLESKHHNGLNHPNHKPQFIISILFLVVYFLMLGAIFVVESSDSINMLKGNNSLMGELQILFGVLTAGVGQVLSYWFGGVLGNNDPQKNQ